MKKNVRRNEASEIRFQEALKQYAKEGDVVAFTTLAIHEANRILPNGNPEEQELVLMLLRVVSLLEYDVEVAAQRPHGFSKAGFHLCWVLWLAGPIGGVAAASLMGESRATVSGISATLTREGLVERCGSDDDQRLVLLSLSEHGRKRFEAAMRDVNKRNSDWANSLSKTEIRQLVQLLTKLAVGANPRFHRRS